MSLTDAIAALERVRRHQVGLIDDMNYRLARMNDTPDVRTMRIAARERLHEELAAIDMALSLLMKAPLAAQKEQP